MKPRATTPRLEWLVRDLRLVDGKPLSMTEKLALFALAANADANGASYASHATLARITSMAERTVRNALQSLVGRGVVDCRCAAGKTSTYVLNASHLQRLVDATPARVAAVTSETAAPGAKTPAAYDTSPRHLTTATPAPAADKADLKQTNEANVEAPPLPAASLGASSPAKRPPAKSAKSERLQSDADLVFGHWTKLRREFGKTDAVKFTSERRTKVQARLRDYTVDDLCRALDGMFATPWNRGEDPRSNGRAFLDLELACRDGSHVERFRDAAPVVAPPQATPVTPARADIVPPPPEAIAAMQRLRADAIPSFAKSEGRPGADVRWMAAS